MAVSRDDLRRIRTAYRMAAGMAVVAGVFVLVLAIQMTAAHVMSSGRPSPESPVLERLRLDLQAHPDDAALKDEIRSLDLLARRAYFTNLNAMRTGGLLLIVGVAVTLASIRIMKALRRRLPDPTQYGAPMDAWDNIGIARWTVAGAAVVCVGAAAVLAIMVSRDMRPNVELAAAVGMPANSKLPVLSDQSAAKSVAVSGGEDLLNNWPSFRGPGGLGVAHGANMPVAWDAKSGSNILWKVPVPRPGASSPVVWGKKVFLSGADKANREVYCFDADSGLLLWRKEVTGIAGSPAEPPMVSEETGYAAPTMAADGKHVFAIFATADIVSFDPDGKQMWGRNLGAPENHYGYASSLITYGSLLIVPFDSDTGGRVLALDTATGQTSWDKPRANVQNSWASPMLVHTGARAEVILNSSPRVAGYDPMTGNELWSVDCMGGEVAASPAYGAGMVFVANEYVRLAAVKPDVLSKLIWEYGEELPSVASPVANDQFLFMASSGGVVTCLDPKTGAVFWKHEFSKGFYASPILTEDRVYLLDVAGRMSVVAAEKTFRLVAATDIGEPCVSTPALVNGRIYIRGKANLYGIGTRP